MDYIQSLSQTLCSSIYNNHYPIPLNTIIFNQNLIIKDEYDSSDTINGPVTYETIGNYILFYMKREFDNGSEARFVEFILEDEDEANNTIILNIVCQRRE